MSELIRTPNPAKFENVFCSFSHKTTNYLPKFEVDASAAKQDVMKNSVTRDNDNSKYKTELVESE